MHEYSVANAMFRTVLTTIKEKEVSKVLEVFIEIGELTHLNPDQVEFWLSELFAMESKTKEAKVAIKIKKALVKCTECGHEGKAKLEGNYFLRLPRCFRCGSFNVKIIGGRECLVKKVKAFTSDSVSGQGSL